MSSENMPKEFEKTTEVLPITKKGLSTVKEFMEVEDQIRATEKLKKAGLSDDEIKLYKDNEAGNAVQPNKIEFSIMKIKLDAIYKKINKFDEECQEKEKPSTSEVTENAPKFQQSSIPIYPQGHPMNDIKDLEQQMFAHHKTDAMPSLTKRRKTLRRLERKKQRLQQKEHVFLKPTSTVSQHRRLNSKWDSQTPQQVQNNIQSAENKTNKKLFGPQKVSMYTVKDNKIVRLGPIQGSGKSAGTDRLEPEGERELLEGTKMPIDEIRKDPQFKNYQPGLPSKTLLLKNIESSITESQLSVLFNQFVLDNGGPIEVTIAQSTNKNTALVVFRDEDIAIQALEETNGTILSGNPIIAFFKQDEHGNT